ncbi:MAG: HAD-IA family hydrolase [Candidatus Korobacteraceae bacterium]|jgi:phosphoglycolate phosphatase
MIRKNKAIPIESIKLLVFDLDGTLVDSQVDLANAVNAMLRNYHRPELPVGLIASYIGDGANMLVRRALGDPADEAFVREAFDIFIKHYREHTLDNTYAYEGMIEALRAIRRHTNNSVAMAVLTNKPVNPSKRIIKGLGMEDLFAHVYGGNSFDTKKPDPLGALTLLRETSTEPAEAVMIGDSQNDVLTARNSGMWAVGVTYGFSPDSLKSPAPDVLIDSPHELFEALGYGSRRKSLEIPSGQGFAG